MVFGKDVERTFERGLPGQGAQMPAGSAGVGIRDAAVLGPWWVRQRGCTDRSLAPDIHSWRYSQAPSVRILNQTAHTCHRACRNGEDNTMMFLSQHLHTL